MEMNDTAMPMSGGMAMEYYMGGTSWEMIRTLVASMQADQGLLMTKMRDILLRYDGDWIIPMIDVENEPKMPQLTPALIGEAIDQIALRAASVPYQVTSPAINFAKDRGKESREFATIRSQIIRTTYEQSRWKLGMRRMYRHLTAYHTAAAVVTPDFKNQIPRIDTRDPLCSYVENQAAESLRDPEYCAFVNRFSGTFLRNRFPKVRSEFGGPITGLEGNRMWEIVEWYDDCCVCWGLLGPVDMSGAHVAGASNITRYTSMANAVGSGYSSQTVQCNMELARYPNRLGFPPVMMPHNVSLGRIASRVGAMIGNVDLQAKMMALFVVAQEKAVFPDTYIIGENGKEPQVTSGAWRDGRTGEVNTVRDASMVGVLRTTADPNTGQMIDRLERNFRTSTSLVPQLGGETYGALRTGRGIDALGSMALDPRIQEMHEITEAYVPNLNKAILQTYKAYWGSKSYSMYCGAGLGRKMVTFVPETHIETLENGVSYRVAGAEVMQLTQVLGSLLGAGVISQKSFMDDHPYVEDADSEAAQIRMEKLEAAVMESLQQQVVSGQLPHTVLSKVAGRLAKGDGIFDVIDAIDKELRDLQAAAPPPAPPGMAMDPSQAPGLTGGPAADQAQPVPEQIQVPQGASNMRQLIQTMSGQGAGSAGP